MKLPAYLLKNRDNLNLAGSALKKNTNIGMLLKEQYGEGFFPPGLIKKSIEVEATSLEKAFEIASEKFKVDISKLDYKIIQNGNKSLLGLKQTLYKVRFIYHNTASDSAIIETETNLQDFEVQSPKMAKWHAGELELEVNRKGKFLIMRAYKDKNKTHSCEKVMKFLHQNGIQDADENVIKVYVKKKNTQRVALGAWEENPAKDGKVFLILSEDKMQAFIRYTYPKMDGKPVDFQDVWNFLMENGIVYGVDKKKIEDAVKMQQENIPYLIAKGEPVQQGVNAAYNYKVDVNKKYNLEGANVNKADLKFEDFRKIISVKKDQTIIEKVPHTHGSNGQNVLGEVIEAIDGKDVELQGGENTYVTVDQKFLKASINGHVVRVNNRLVVKEVYVVRGNVGPDTGNIKSDSSVVVYGQVLNGYNIFSGGNIQIFHNVSNSIIEAEGDISISLGVYGKNKARIISKHGTIQAKYIQESFVQAEGEIWVDESLIRSDVNSNASVILSGNKGTIVGGVTRAVDEIYCKKAGSVAGTKTLLEVGISPVIRLELLKYQKLVKSSKDNLINLERQIVTLQAGHGDSTVSDNKKKLEEAQMELKTLQESIPRYEAAILDYGAQLENATTQGKISVFQKLFSGVIMHCNTAEIIHKKDQGPAQYLQDDENPDFVSLEQVDLSNKKNKKNKKNTK